MPRRALLVIDYDTGTGLGHLRRMAALSTALAGRGWEARCGRATEGTASIPLTGTSIDHLDALDVSRLAEARGDFEACVIDSYRIPEKLRMDLAPYVAVDDLGEAGDGAEIIVNAAGGTYPDGPELLLGPRYALVGTDVVAAASAARPATFPPAQVLVALGAGASHGILAEVLAAIAEGVANAMIDVAGVLSGPGPVGRATGVAQRIAVADLVICAGGVTALEAAAMGRPMIGLTLAENQAANIEMLAGAGALIPSATSPAALAEAIDQIDAEKFAAMSRSGPRAVDGHGAERVAEAIDNRFGSGRR